MARKTKISTPLIIIGAIVAIGSLVLKLIISILDTLAVPLLIVGSTIIIILFIYFIFQYIYFKSDKFKQIREEIRKYIENCNDLNHHIIELRNSFSEIKIENQGKANLEDSSNYNFQRKEWANFVKTSQVYNCSATICKNASLQPFKYLCKYFNIEIKEETLSEFERVLNDFSAAEQGKKLLKDEKEIILENIKSKIPWLIYQFSKKRLEQELGFEEFDFDDFYFPVYKFQYVSAGGNSSTNCNIELDIDNLEKFIFYLNDLIKFRKSIHGQRALMTANLREKIKTRDNYTCRKCTISTSDERNLLLEIDHIIPLSKGGITSENNLQTLCWRCNRTKGSKIEIQYANDL